MHLTCLSTFVIGPIAMILGAIVRRADTLVVVVPIAVFITMLPGLLYFDLAFDLQRSMLLELVLCTLPPSAVALALRQVLPWCNYL